MRYSDDEEQSLLVSGLRPTQSDVWALNIHCSCMFLGITEYNFLEYFHEISTIESVVLKISIMHYRPLFP